MSIWASPVTPQPSLWAATRKGQGDFGAVLRCASLIWNNQSSLLAPRTALKSHAVAFMQDREMSSGHHFVARGSKILIYCRVNSGLTTGILPFAPAGQLTLFKITSLAP